MLGEKKIVGKKWPSLFSDDASFEVLLRQHLQMNGKSGREEVSQSAKSSSTASVPSDS